MEGTGFTNRLGLPEPWRGVRDEALTKISGIADCCFCHAVRAAPKPPSTRCAPPRRSNEQSDSVSCECRRGSSAGTRPRRAPLPWPMLPLRAANEAFFSQL